MPDPKDIFSGTAKYYRKYRRPYAEEMMKDIRDYFSVDGAGVLLDIGCGTGELTVPLAPYFEEAIGLDPSEEMLLEAEARAREEKVSNIRWVCDRAENIEDIYAPIRLATAGVSFHWMDQDKVLHDIYTSLEPGGGVAIVNEGSPVRGRNKTEPWKARRMELIATYLGPERRAGKHFHREFVREKRDVEDIIAVSPFKRYECKTYAYETKRGVDEIIGFLWSTSYANRELLGRNADNFERDLRSELLRIEPSGIFVEPGLTELFLLKK